MRSQRFRCVIAVAVLAVVGAALAAPSAAVPAAEPQSWAKHKPVDVGDDTFANELASVSCWTVDGCVAVGQRITIDGTRHPLAERWSRKGWVVMDTPDPGDGDDDGQLAGVSCPSATMCVAVGSHTTDPGALPLVEIWNGSTWRVVSVPSPNTQANDSSTLLAVSCPTASRCVAVGSSSAGSLALRFARGRWTLMSTPDPSTKSNLLDGVSCATASRCLAVGQHADVTHDFATDTWAVSLTGTTWKTVASPSPAAPTSPGIPDNHLYAVTCTTATYCVAVGKFHNEDKAQHQTLVATWNGKKLTRVASPNVDDAADNVLLAVSCATKLACAAVGYHSPSPSSTLVQAWQGSYWATKPSPNAPWHDGTSAAVNELHGVSCPTGSWCMAVGFAHVDWYVEEFFQSQVLTTQALIGPAVPKPHIKLRPKHASRVVGARQCVRATIRDASGRSIPGLKVHFTVTGANPRRATSTTNEPGTATYCWRARHRGTDQVRAETEGITSNRSTVTWTRT